MSNKVSGKRQKGADSPELREKDARSMAGIMGVFAVAVLGIFPLAYDNYYYNILETKYHFYCVASIAAMALMLFYGIFSGRIAGFFRGDGSEKGGSGFFKRILGGLNFVDWAMLAFWGANVISWILCVDWRWDAFWGTFGRYNGVFLITLYTVVYFLVTRFFRFRQWYLDLFLVTGMLVCGFGITDYFQMDLLHFKAELSADQHATFVSTFGNINTYTVYVGAVLAVSMTLFTLDKDWRKRLWYFAAMMVSSVAIIMGTSDNAYLTLGALLGFLPLYLFRTWSGIRRYLMAAAGFFTAAWIVEWANVKYADKVLGIDSLFTMFVQYEHFKEIVLALWIAAAVLTVLTIRRKGEKDRIGRWPCFVWLGFLAFIAAGVIYVLYDANAAGNAEKYAAISKYVVFNDAWGTNRGYAWIRSMEVFREFFTTKDKIFGYGPETFRVLMENYYLGELGNVIFDNAHNEYLHYLITIGLFGMLSYMAWLGTSIFWMARNLKDRPEVAACLFALAAYAVQATVNLNLPVAMPVTVQLLAMGVSRQLKKKENESI